MELALKLIPAPTALIPVEGAGHDLLASRKSTVYRAHLRKTVVDAFRAFIQSLPWEEGRFLAPP